jgi:hypothetical protein
LSPASPVMPNECMTAPALGSIPSGHSFLDWFKSSASMNGCDDAIQMSDCKAGSLGAPIRRPLHGIYGVATTRCCLIVRRWVHAHVHCGMVKRYRAGKRQGKIDRSISNWYIQALEFTVDQSVEQKRLTKQTGHLLLLLLVFPPVHGPAGSLFCFFTTEGIINRLHPNDRTISIPYTNQPPAESPLDWSTDRPPGGDG